MTRILKDRCRTPLRQHASRRKCRSLARMTKRSSTQKRDAGGAAKTGRARKLRIGVLFGGRSGEHEVSLLSAASVLSAIDAAKYDVVPIGVDKQGRWLTGAEAGRLLGGVMPTLAGAEKARAVELAGETAGAGAQ